MEHIPVYIDLERNPDGTGKWQEAYYAISQKYEDSRSYCRAHWLISRELVNLLVSLRKEYKDNKNYEEADRIRLLMLEHGVQLKDNKDDSVEWESTYSPWLAYGKITLNNKEV